MTITPFEQEYPEAAEVLVDIYQQKAQRRLLHFKIPIMHGERNSLCDCGSGIKTKKCCMQTKPVTKPNYWSIRILKLNGKDVDLFADNTTLKPKIRKPVSKDPFASVPQSFTTHKRSSGLGSPLFMAGIAAAMCMMPYYPPHKLR